MAEFPALPLFTDAYLGDTTHLTTIEHGAYLLLLMTAWRTPTTSLPDDDKLLARYARCTSGQWKRLRPVISSFFVIKDGLWKQSRLTDEAVTVRQIREKRAKAGSLSALKRKGRHSTHVEQSDSDAPTESQQIDNTSVAPTPTPTPSSDTKVSAAQAAPDDPVKEIFDTGVALLAGAGRSSGAARSIIGKWRKERGDAPTLAAIIAARDANASDPVEWITGRFRSFAEEEDASRAASRATAERYRRMDIPGPPPGELKH